MGRVRFYGGKAVGSVRIGDFANLLDGETITIGGKVFEWDNNASVGAGNVAVTIGASNAACATNLRDAINANPPATPVTASIDPVDTATVRIIANSRGSAGNLALATTMADGDNVLSGAAMIGGENGGTQRLHRGEYAVTALDAAAGSVVIPTGHTTARFAQVEVRSAAGVLKSITDKVTVSAGNIVIDVDGATNIAATDVITWVCWE